MPKLTTTDLMRDISLLKRDAVYTYVGGRSRLKLVDIGMPEGPIKFANLKADNTLQRYGSISKEQLAQIAAICSAKPNYPLHIDRIFSAGGNSRSALETVLAYTPHFFICRPQRVHPYSGKVLQNLKHIMWCPDETHDIGVIATKNYDEIITELELALSFDKISIPKSALSQEFDNIEAKRTHVQMQIALITIGKALGFKTWIAYNDRSILVGNKKLGDMEGVIGSLDEMSIFHNSDIKKAASLIDCIWFTADGKRVPAIIEIEHSTGITSGATRMTKFQDSFPSLQTKFVVVADSALRHKATVEANQDIFRELDLRFMPYDTVREMYGLLLKYELAGAVDHRFIDPFLEKLVKI